MEGIGLPIDTLHQVAALGHRDALRRAEIWQLSYSFQSSQPNWFVQQRCQILCRFGHTLVQLGRWLERRATIQAT